MGGRWRATSLPRHAFAAMDGVGRSESADRQDLAAGGHAHRLLDTGGSNRVLSRIRFVQRPRTRRVYAYLVWLQPDRRELLLGEVTAHSREANLIAAWRVVHDNDLLTPQGRASWSERRAQSNKSRSELD